MIEALKPTVWSISIVSSHDPQDVDTKRLPFADAAEPARSGSRPCSAASLAACA
jgi:dihydroorotase